MAAERTNDLSLELLERVTRIEGRGEARDAWQRQMEERLAQLQAAQLAANAKLDALMQELQTARAVARFSGGVLGLLIRSLPAVGAGGAVAWIIQHFGTAPE